MVKAAHWPEDRAGKGRTDAVIPSLETCLYLLSLSVRGVSNPKTDH